jgi:fructose-specific phosphotransferase system IIC component
MNAIGIIMCAIALDNQDMLDAMEISKKVAFVSIVESFIEGICIILLLNWKKIGFSLYCTVSIFYCIFNPNISTIVLGIFGLLLSFALLQLKKNGISAWTHLTSDYSSLNNILDIDNVNEKRDEYKKCLFCAEDIKKDAIICRFCQRSVNQAS